MDNFERKDLYKEFTIFIIKHIINLHTNEKRI